LRKEDTVRKRRLKASRYVEELARNLKKALPYYEDGLAKLQGEKSRKNKFPNDPGVYAILRKSDIPEINYRYKGLSTKSPIAIYVGKATSKRTKCNSSKMKQKCKGSCGRLILLSHVFQ
jgi:hypothetical protein